MKRVVYIICAIAVSLCNLAKVAGAPIAEISEEEKVFDLGNICVGDSASHDFKIRNAGEGALVIQNVSTSCECTVAEWTAMPVSEGDTAIVRITHIPEYLGSFTQKMVVKCNAKEKRITLKLKGNAIKKERR